jgi:hypothetical protein
MLSGIGELFVLAKDDDALPRHSRSFICSITMPIHHSGRSARSRPIETSKRHRSRSRSDERDS